MKLTISRKIGGLAVILILFILIILIHSIFVLKSIERELTEIAEYDIPISEIATIIEIKQLEQHIYLEKIVKYYHNKAENTEKINVINDLIKVQSSQINTEIDRGIHLLDSGINKLDTKSKTAKSLTQLNTLFQKLSKNHREFDSQISKSLEKFNTMSNVDITEVNIVETLEEKMDKQTIHLTQLVEELTLRKAETVEKHEEAFYRINIILTLSGIFLGIVLSTIVIVGIKSKLFKLNLGAKQITDAIKENKAISGDVLNIDANDEFQELSNSLSQLVAQFSVNISEKEEMAKELETFAVTDRLTTAYNRYKWDHVIDLEMERMKRKYFNLSIIMLDIDHFKNINDNFGHDIGDEVLITLSRLIKSNIRKLDYFFRLGGEEFAILTIDTDREEAFTIAEKIRVIIAETSFNKVDNVSISLGVAQFMEYDTLDSFIKRSDQALYQAKNQGRNCVKVL